MSTSPQPLELGRACLSLGRLDDAQRRGDQALQHAPPHPAAMAYSFHLLGDIAAHPDRFDPERAEGHYRQALALAESRGMRPLVAHCHLGLGNLYVRSGKRDRAEQHLHMAGTMCREMAMSYWFEEATVALRRI